MLMKTVFLLLAQYDATAVVPIDLVCRDFFPHLSTDKLIRKINIGEVKLPMIRMERSAKSAKGVHIQDLADYIDARRAEATKELEQMGVRI
jgi:hypothetical protein